MRPSSFLLTADSLSHTDTLWRETKYDRLNWLLFMLIARGPGKKPPELIWKSSLSRQPNECPPLNVDRKIKSRADLLVSLLLLRKRLCGRFCRTPRIYHRTISPTDLLFIIICPAKVTRTAALLALQWGQKWSRSKKVCLSRRAGIYFHRLPGKGKGSTQLKDSLDLTWKQLDASLSK